MVEKKAAAVKPAVAESGDGNESNLLSALGYIIGLLAIVMYLVRKEDKYVRFHSVQSIILWVAWTLIWIGFTVMFSVLTAVIGGLGICLSFIILPIFLFMAISCLYPAYKAFNGEEYELPYIGKIARKYV